MPLNQSQTASWINVQKIIMRALEIVDFEVSTEGCSYADAVDIARTDIMYASDKSNIESIKGLLAELQLRFGGNHDECIALSFSDMPLLGKLLGADSHNMILPTGSKMKNGKILDSNGEEIKAMSIRDAIRSIVYNGGPEIKGVMAAIDKFDIAQKRKAAPVRPAAPTATESNKKSTAPLQNDEKPKTFKDIKKSFEETIVQPYKGLKNQYEIEQREKREKEEEGKLSRKSSASTNTQSPDSSPPPTPKGPPRLKT